MTIRLIICTVKLILYAVKLIIIIVANYSSLIKVENLGLLFLGIVSN